MKYALVLLLTLATLPLPSRALEDSSRTVLIRDIASVEGVRENSVIGYGIVVGLRGTGDKQQTIFTTQTLANMLQRMGVQVPATTMIVKNVAAVFVTATLPPFASPGTRLDVTVSSAGDARSLEGGLLLLTPLYGADGVVYAAAQGPLTLGGYREGSGANVKQQNHPTVGRIPNGALVERDSSVNLNKLAKLSLILTDTDFSTAEAVAAAINQEFKASIASVIDGRRVDIDAAAASPAGISSVNPARTAASGPSPVSLPASASSSPASVAPPPDLPALLARVENLPVQVHRRAKVVVNERTGTVVMGRDVRLGAVSILHGNFSIEVATQLAVSQPNPLAQGQTAVTPQTTVKAEEAPARRIELNEGASVEQLVNGLQAIGATARDVIAILQAIKTAGALEADLEVI